MKTIKKLLALTLVLCMVFCLSVAVFADGERYDETTGTGSSTKTDDYKDYLGNKVVVPKKYEVNNGTAPAETFTFNFEGVSYVNGEGETVASAAIPAIADKTIEFSAISTTTNLSNEFTLTSEELAAYDLGVYTYKVTEVVPTAPATKTAGVTYSDEELYLVLTILRDTTGKNYVAAMHYQTATGTDKSTGFKNTYNAGSLEVKKIITGNMADMNKEFTFTVTFAAPEGTEIKSVIGYNQNAKVTKADDSFTYTFKLGNDQSLTFTNIPAGTTYTVTEDAEKYTSDNGVFSDPSKTINTTETDTVTFTNTLQQGVDTGISLDSLPYILALAVAFGGAVVLFTRKRHVED